VDVVKILFLAGANSPHSHRWIQFFRDRGHEVAWMTLHPPLPETSRPNAFVEATWPRGMLRLPAAAAKVRRMTRELEPDILHVHSAGSYGLIGAMARFHPTVLTAWGSDILIDGRSASKRLVVKFVLKSADLITCDATHMQEAMISLGADPRKIRRINFGVDVNTFCPGSPDEVLRATLGLGDRPTVISTRNLEPVYDLATLIRAIPAVVARVPQAAFVIAGEGSAAKELGSLANRLGVTESIRFVGRIPNSGLPTYLRSADVYVSTALSDAGIAASTAEAMATELPVVVTGTGENAQWIKEGEQGFVVSAGDSGALAQRISDLLTNPVLGLAMGAAGRAVVVAHNNYDTEMHRMEELYVRIATSTQPDSSSTLGLER